MTIGILKIVIFIYNSNSLKEKRMILQSLKGKLRNKFNIAVTEIQDEDKWQKATLAIVGVEKNRNRMNACLSCVINFVGSFNHVHLIDHEMGLI